LAGPAHDAEPDTGVRQLLPRIGDDLGDNYPDTQPSWASAQNGQARRCTAKTSEGTAAGVAKDLTELIAGVGQDASGSDLVGLAGEEVTLDQERWNPIMRPYVWIAQTERSSVCLCIIT
jgi:hypothetical protein